MALFCLVSAGGSPGVTTTAVGLALTWPRPVLLAECDPSHRALLPGFLSERLTGSPGPGLLGLAMESQHGTSIAADALDHFLISLDGQHGQARLLHGVHDPRHVAHLKPLWPELAELFTTVDDDVIADLGCIGGSDTPMPLITQADLVVMVVRRTLPQVDAARPRLDLLRETLPHPPALCVINDGPYETKTVANALFELPVVGELPEARKEARVLSHGVRPHRTFRTSLLVRSINGLGRRMRAAVDQRSTNAGGDALVEPKSFGRM